MNHLLTAFIVFIYTSFYSLPFIHTDGTTTSLSNFSGKKVLLVNIATASPRVEQLRQLQQLQEQHGSRLVVIGFPSNSFGKEPRTNEAIKAFCQSNYGVSFRLAQVGSVKGADIQSIYNWLLKKSENGTFDSMVAGDYQKYLINEQGMLIGEFAPGMSPLSIDIQNAIVEE